MHSKAILPDNQSIIHINITKVYKIRVFSQKGQYSAMRYDKEKDIIYTGVREAIASISRGIFTSNNSLRASDFIIPERYKKLRETKLSYEFTHAWQKFAIEGSVYDADGEDITVFIPLLSLKEKSEKQYRGEAFLLAAMYIREVMLNADGINIKAVYYIEGTEEEECISEYIKRKKLVDFLGRCENLLPAAAKAETERFTVRIPSMRSAKFPYGKPRDGQDEFIRASYRAICKGQYLYATAPTGTGKTVSALFPAVRALGNEKCSKVFYLTPKTTTAAAAKDCIEKLCEGGAIIRSAAIIAKDRVCTEGGICKISKKLCEGLSEKKTVDAARAIYDDRIICVMPDDFISFGKKFGVCPYELSLTYAELCDIIICDINYLFDPQVYIRRFFSSSSNYAFLIDEAHNLGERTRDMYSAEISTSEIASADILSELSPLGKCSANAAASFYESLEPLLRDEIRKDKDGIPHSAYHTRDLPDFLYDMFDNLVRCAEEELFAAFSAKDEERDERIVFLRDYLFKLKKFNSALLRFDESFEFFIFLDGDAIRAKVFCLDTGPIIRERLELGHGAVIFSGTLTPIDYYRSILGGGRYSPTLVLDSPFDSENLSVSIMNKITTRISEREDSLPAICRVIAATLSAKRGNYMIFTPSFAYAEALADSFSKKYPKIKVILQRQNMSAKERREFLDEFSKEDKRYLAAFCVLGGIYSEGIDLVGDKLIGAVIVGIGMPALSFEREAIAAYYEERLEEGTRYAYLYPGINRVLQAAGRVIRTEDDRGVIVLIDDRFDDPIYKKTVPKIWSGMEFLGSANELRMRLDEFWSNTDNENK